MTTTERHIEAAEAAVQRAQDSAIARAIDALSGAGSADCVQCGEPIEAARRAALPSATRCVGCQARLERGSRGY